MKKIFFYIMTVILFASCQDDLQTIQTGELEDGKVRLNFSVNVPDIPVASRSFTDPAVTSLHLVIFDENGYLVEKVPATITDVNTDDITDSSSDGYSATDEIRFSAEVKTSVAKRTIHFIANYPDAMKLAFGSESDVVGSIKHNGSTDAYWQCMEFVDGINGNTTIGCVPLVHNYAKITVTNKCADFTLESFTVVNVVTEGYLAPYNMNTGNFAPFIAMSDGQFVQTDGKFVCRDYVDITSGEEGYEGYVPSTAELNLDTEINENSWITDGAFYMYERSFETTNHTFAIVKGSYDDHASTYYKVDLVYQDENGVTQYYNILRNFEYAIEITDVTGDGKQDAATAYAMKYAHNNLSASVATKSLTNISDGYSQLYVSYTSEYIVSSGDVELYYKYIPDLRGDTNDGYDTGVAYNDASNIVYDESGDVISGLTISTTDETTGDYAGWRKITITPKDIDVNEAKKQEINIVAGNLSRTITYILKAPYAMSAVCWDGDENESDMVVPAEIKSDVNITISIPTNLPEALFPLTFYMEAKERTIYPDAVENQLPVEIIPSELLTGSHYDDIENTFGFTKELTYEEYTAIQANTDGTKSFVCKFLTNTAASASQVYVYNKYFIVAESSFSN